MPSLIHFPQSECIDQNLDDAENQDGKRDSVGSRVQVIIVFEICHDGDDCVHEADGVDDENDDVVEARSVGAQSHEEQAADGDDDVGDDCVSTTGRRFLAVGWPTSDDGGDEGDDDVRKSNPIQGRIVVVEEDTVSVDEVLVECLVDCGGRKESLEKRFGLLSDC